MKSLILSVLLGLLMAGGTACNRSSTSTANQSATPTNAPRAGTNVSRTPVASTPTNPVAVAPPRTNAIKTPVPTPPTMIPATNSPKPAPVPPVPPVPAAPAATNTGAAAGAAAAKEFAIIKTTQGEMVVEFWPEVAPKTVESFKALASKGFYDGTAFHRIVQGFMIQGGDPLSKTDDPKVGTGNPGYTLKAEFNDRPHVRGVLSMARSQDPDSAGSQFFICLATASSLDRQYTTFGKLIKGDEVLGRIGDTPVGPSAMGEKSKPLTRVGVESIKIVPASQIK